ncbi:MAG: GNAT family N-acetyltransferase [Polaromonas sp.]|nr:GNAT family N-acetyltransferase [Gemmatimonadaceae bacterium]
MRLSSLRPEHRGQVSELLIATAAFSSEEVEVALELFDATYPSCRPERSEGPAFANDEMADYEFLGAFDVGDQLLGYACFGPTPSTDGTWDLYWLAVHPAAQGRGAGRALVREVEQILVARQGRLLAVETSSRESYAHSREFYARCGYTEAARVRDFYAPADDRIILTTRLMARPVGVATR